MRALGRRPELVALISVFIGAAIVVGKLVVGLLTGSLGIISEAVHSLLDLAASGFTLVAVRTARKPADTEHPYVHWRRGRECRRLCIRAADSDAFDRARPGCRAAKGRARRGQRRPAG